MLATNMQPLSIKYTLYLLRSAYCGDTVQHIGLKSRVIAHRSDIRFRFARRVHRFKNTWYLHPSVSQWSKQTCILTAHDGTSDSEKPAANTAKQRKIKTLETIILRLCKTRRQERNGITPRAPRCS